jgi:hypothetical protein
MAKAGMRRPDPGDPHGTESDQTMRRRIDPRVPGIEGKAKTGNAKAGKIKKKRKNCFSGEHFQTKTSGHNTNGKDMFARTV